MKETLAIIEQMKKDGVIGNYAIGGAVGATFYLEPFATIDIDVFVSLKPASGSLLLSLTPIYEYLTAPERACKVEGEYIKVGGWDVQFLPPGNPLEEEAIKEAVEADVDEIKTRIMTAEHLVAIALNLSRSKDFGRILEFLKSGKVDKAKLDAIINKHGLLAKWTKFCDRFFSDL